LSHSLTRTYNLRSESASISASFKKPLNPTNCFTINYEFIACPISKKRMHTSQVPRAAAASALAGNANIRRLLSPPLSSGSRTMECHQQPCVVRPPSAAAAATTTVTSTAAALVTPQLRRPQRSRRRADVCNSSCDASAWVPAQAFPEPDSEDESNPYPLELPTSFELMQRPDGEKPKVVIAQIKGSCHSQFRCMHSACIYHSHTQ